MILPSPSFHCLLIIFLFSCFHHSAQINKQTQQTAKRSALDFFNLKDKKLQHNFFQKFDSAKTHDKVYVLGGRVALVEINPALLDRILNDVKPDEFAKSGYFEKQYHFGGNKKGANKSCQDRVALTYNPEDNSFELEIDTLVYIDSFGCSEHAAIYHFEIKGKKIIHFRRDLAG